MSPRRTWPDGGPQVLPTIQDHATFERGVAALPPDVLDDLLRLLEPAVHLFVAEIEKLIGYFAMTLDYAPWEGARSLQAV